METDVRKLKHKAKLQEWREKIVECRSSGECVKTWCKKQGIGTKTYYYWEKQVLRESVQRPGVPAISSSGPLMRIETEKAFATGPSKGGNSITVHYKDSTLEIPIGMDPEDIASLICALNRHA